MAHSVIFRPENLESTFAAFVFLFVFGFLWYATLMHDAHREVPTLLRPEADLKSYFGWLALGQRDYCRNSAGSPAGIAAIGMRLGFYAVQPIPGKLIVYGSIGAVIEMVIVGAMVGTIYKPTSAWQP